MLTQLGCCHPFSCLFCCLHSFRAALQRNWKWKQALILHILAGAFTMDLFSKLSNSFWHGNSGSCWLVLFGYIRFFVDGVGKMSNWWCDGNNRSVITTLVTLLMYLTPIPTTQWEQGKLPAAKDLRFLSAFICNVTLVMFVPGDAGEEEHLRKQKQYHSLREMDVLQRSTHARGKCYTYTNVNISSILSFLVQTFYKPITNTCHTQ